MKVKLKSPWFVDGAYYKCHNDGTEIPDHLKDRLPEGAKIIEGPKAAKAPPEKKGDAKDDKEKQLESVLGGSKK
jgi:hypothetical protein